MNYKCYLIIELVFLKELILTKQANQKSAVFVVFLDKRFCLQPYLCNGLFMKF